MRCSRCGTAVGGALGFVSASTGPTPHDHEIRCLGCDGAIESPRSINLRPLRRETARATPVVNGDCRHESAHAAAAVLVGIRIEELRPDCLRVHPGDLEDDPFGAAVIACAPQADNPSALMSDEDRSYTLGSRDDVAEAREVLRRAPGLVDELEAALRESGHLSGAEVESIARSFRRA